MAATDYKKQFLVPEGYAIPSSRNACPTTDEVRRENARGIGTLADDIETAIVALLTRTLSTDEPHLVAAERSELALCEIIDGLTAAQALMLGRRLDANREGDRIAVAFRRFTSGRRQRLRAYLADLRRRHAHRAAATASERCISEEE